MTVSSALGAGLIGTGFIGPVHVEALRRLGVPVRAVVSSAPDRARQAAARLGIPQVHDTFAELLADPSVHVVHLTSPNRLHHEQCRQALAAGKHVICEKPLALTTGETGELARLAARSSLISAVCYNVRFYPLCLEARERIRAGELGTIYHVSGSYLQDWLLYDTDFNWRVLAEEGGATVFATVSKADGQKCERCWHWETDISQNAEHPTICSRCVEAVNQFMA